MKNFNKHVQCLLILSFNLWVGQPVKQLEVNVVFLEQNTEKEEFHGSCTIKSVMLKIIRGVRSIA